jgi:hypothetical protein
MGVGAMSDVNLTSESGHLFGVTRFGGNERIRVVLQYLRKHVLEISSRTAFAETRRLWLWPPSAAKLQYTLSDPLLVPNECTRDRDLIGVH